MPADPIAKQSNKTFDRVASIIAIAAVCAFCWFAVRTQIGSLLADVTSPSRDDALKVAEFAADLAPLDPKPPWLARGVSSGTS